MANPNPSPATRFVPGNSGGGRNPSKRKAGEACWNDLFADWEVNGAEAVMRMREENPSAYVQLVASGLPAEKSIDLNLRKAEDITPERALEIAESYVERTRRQSAVGDSTARLNIVHTDVSA